MTDHERNLYNKRVEAQEDYIEELQGVIQSWLAFQGDLAEVLYGNRITWKGGTAEIETVKALVKTHKRLLDMHLVSDNSPEEHHAELKKAFQKVADEEAEAVE